MVNLKYFWVPWGGAEKYFELTTTEKNILWDGKNNWKGINSFFNFLQRKSYKIQYRVMLSRYRGKTICPSCNGSRLRKDTNYVKLLNQFHRFQMNI